MRRTRSGPTSRDRGLTALLGDDSWRFSSIALASFALMAACQKIWDTDIFWHLTEGEWALKHHTLLRVDHWSVLASARSFVTDYSLYHLVITTLHSVAGFGGLSILNMLVFATIALILAGTVPERARGASAALCLAAALFVVQIRMRVRPETFTFLYLAITIAILERARRGELASRRLWWLPAIMVLWVNMHSLFAVGLATIWMAVIGRWWDLKRVPWDWMRVAGGSTLACLVNPTPLQLIQQPIRFLGQANARVATYAYGFAEFLPSWREPGAPEVIVVIVLLALALLGMGIGRRRRRVGEGDAMRLAGSEVPTAHLLWLAAFGYLGAVAFRNLALAGLVGGYLAASHVGGAIPGRRRWAVRGASAAIVLLGISYLTGEAGDLFNRTGRPGVGLLADFFPLEIAKRIAASDVPGDILPLDFGDGGPLIYAANRDRADPKTIIHRVYIDGRSDVFPEERYDEVFRIEEEIASGPESADRVVLPPTIRFLVVNFNDLEALRSLGASSRFRLWCLDRNHACFVRSDDAPLARLSPGWSAFDRPLSVDLSDALIGPAGDYRRTWFRRHPLDTQWRLGTVFAILGKDDLAVRYLECAEMLDCGPRAPREGMLAMVLGRQREGDSARGGLLLRFKPPADTDPFLSRALYLLRRPGVCDPRTEEGRTHAIQRVLLLDRAGARDLAAEEIDRLVRARGGVSDPDVISLRDEIHGEAHEEGEAASYIASHPGLEVLSQDSVLSSAGMSRRALALLVHEASPAAVFRQGDILLRIGDVGAARRLFTRMGDDPKAQERLALCAWAEGDLKGMSAWLANPRGDYSLRFALAGMFQSYLGRHNVMFDLPDRNPPHP